MLKKFFITVLLFLIVTASYAQIIINPCDDGDEDTANCPLDTWIIILVVAALIFTTIHLYRKQKSLQA